MKVLLGVLLTLGLVSCDRTMRASVTQPNPLKQPLETLRESEPVVIVTGDMDLQMPRNSGSRGPAGDALLVNKRYPLMNVASFTVVSRDRLRFHVQIEHKWQKYVDVSTWDAVLIDDRGRRYKPDDVDLLADRHIVEMWDYETRTARRNGYGNIVQVMDDGWKQRNPLGSLSVFRGKGDLVFYKRDIFSSDIRWMKLILSRSGTTFEFVWRFDDYKPKRNIASLGD